jgi:DmsE family decaheme c-type cytochrome
MNIKKSLLATLLLLSVFAFNAAAADKPADKAAEPPAAPPSMGAEYSEKGADTCLMCHVEGGDFPVFEIFKTKHANRADKRTPFGPGHFQCEACHGPGKKHADGGGGPDGINSQKPTSFLTPKERNKYCLECHQGGSRIGWHAGVHDSNNLACASCHKIHAERDPVLKTATQPEVCYKCHRKERADFSKPSTHPVRFGKMACSDCHSPHGSNSTGTLIKPTVNQTCYTCHAEKRGPFLWEHAPVAEDCTLCHHPHGSVNQARLKKNPPLLCQQCHSVAGHPSVARTPAGLPGGGGGGSAFLLAGSCLNCHSQIHGSNHPSGAKLMR